jgi:predicted nucleic acid-binding protein
LIIVDTSVLVDFFKGRATPAARRLEQLELEGIPFAIPGICCQELLPGARDAREWDVLLSYLETQNLLFPADPWQTHVEAARIIVDCRARGISLRGTIDCFIAQLVLEHDGVLLHSDKDFERVAEIRPLRAWEGELGGGL